MVVRLCRSTPSCCHGDGRCYLGRGPRRSCPRAKDSSLGHGDGVLPPHHWHGSAARPRISAQVAALDRVLSIAPVTLILTMSYLRRAPSPPLPPTPVGPDGPPCKRRLQLRLYHSPTGVGKLQAHASGGNLRLRDGEKSWEVPCLPSRPPSPAPSTVRSTRRLTPLTGTSSPQDALDAAVTDRELLSQLTGSHPVPVALHYLTEPIHGQPVSHRPPARTDRPALSTKLRLVVLIHGHSRLPGVTEII